MQITTFLSTPSARRATWYMLWIVCQCYISIHALREEGDPARNGSDRYPSNFYPRPPRGGRRFIHRLLLFLLPISIHALREEGDRDQTILTTFDSDFYPRPPRGGRHVKIWNEFFRDQFLSTPSARRATVKVTGTTLHRVDFYPRPPRGGRPESKLRPAIPANFYPRPPRGGRLTNFCVPLMSRDISIHALREEGDSGVRLCVTP